MTMEVKELTILCWVAFQGHAPNNFSTKNHNQRNM